MINIILYKLREQTKGVIYYFIGLFAYVWILVAMYPTMDKFDLSMYPEEMLKFFGADFLALSNFEGFVSMEFLSIFFILIIAFYIGSAAGSTIAGAINEKTMDFQLSQPISRTKIIVSESIVTLFYSFLLVNLTTVSLLLLCRVYNLTIHEHELMIFGLVATLFVWAIYGIGIFISALMKNKTSVAGLTVSIILAFYIVTALANLFDKLKPYEKFSLFYTYNPQKILLTGAIDGHQMLALALVLVIGLSASIIIFNKKDV